MNIHQIKSNTTLKICIQRIKNHQKFLLTILFLVLTGYIAYSSDVFFKSKTERLLNNKIMSMEHKKQPVAAEADK